MDDTMDATMVNELRALLDNGDERYDELLLHVGEVAALFGKGRQTVRDAIHRGTLAAEDHTPPGTPPNRRLWMVRLSDARVFYQRDRHAAGHATIGVCRAPSRGTTRRG